MPPPPPVQQGPAGGVRGQAPGGGEHVRLHGALRRLPRSSHGRLRNCFGLILTFFSALNSTFPVLSASGRAAGKEGSRWRMSEEATSRNVVFIAGV